MNTNGIEISIGATPLADFLDGSSGLDSGSYEQNINGDGKLSLSWRSGSGGGFTAGTEVTLVDGNLTLKYYLKDNYTPTSNGDGTYTWSPTFVSCDNRLKGILVYLATHIYRQFGQNETQPKLVKLYTFPYTGTAGTLVESLNGCDGVDGVIQLHSDYIGIGITVSFDQDNIISAAQKIASALGTNSTIENGVVKIGYHDALAVSEYYDRFVVLGGTRNMGKYVINNDKYAAVTMRLTLDETTYPDSVMPANAPAAGHMTKVLIFDDIYPEMKLTITSVRARICYLYDEDGKLIYIVDENHQRIPKTYTKYYIGLGLNGQPYNFDVKTVIEGRTLGIVFHSGKLTGREFDLAYYDDYVDEYDSDEDVSQDEAHGLAGEYRICLVADGDTLLPNSTLAPAQGDEVTLTGVALDGLYEVDAKRRLLEAAGPYVSMYMSRQPTDVALEEQEVITDFLTGQSSAELGSEQASGSGTYVTTSVTTDILTGRQKVHLGTFEPQGKVASMANRLETASVSGSGATVGGGDDNIRHTAAMSLDQFKTLYDIYGHLGMKTVNNRFSNVDEAMEALRSSFNDVQQQSDRKFDIWFLENAPYPQKDDATAANFPASDWDTDDEKEIHVQDIAYDVSRPSDSDGGRTWRWVSEEDGNGNIIYYWERITDGDTLAALEMLSDMSADNVLTPAEKLVARRDWSAIVAEFAALIQRAATAEVDATAYSEAYYALRAYLHSPTVYVETDQYLLQALGMIRNGEVTDAYTLLISNNITTGTESLAAYISDGDDDDLAAAVTALEADLHSQQKGDTAIINSSGNTVINGQTWKALWDGYYSERTALLSALSGKALGELDDMAADNVLTDIEKLAIIREYERIKEETRELLQQASTAGLDDDSGSTQEAYREAYSLLYSYLDDKTSGYTFTDDLTNHSDPAMLYNGETTAINGTTFASLWSGYYNAAASLRAAIRSAGQRVFVGATAPNPPYKVGDLWVKTSGGKYKLMICITASTKGQPNDAHWTEHEVYKDARSLLASLADYVFAHNENSMPVTVTIGATCSITGSVQGVDNTLALLYHFLGDCTFAISKANSLPDSGNLYDLCCIPVSFQIPGSQEVLTGGCKISMWNGEGWEFLQESTSALIQNLGNKINAVVFGSSAAATEAAGLSIGQRFAKMFATAQVWDSNANDWVTISQALFGLNITWDASANNGKGAYVSSAKMSADKIDFQGKTINLSAANNLGLNASKINFKGQTISMTANDTLTFSGGSIVFDATTSIDFNAAEINLNADKVNWKKDNSQGGFSGDVIPGANSSDPNYAPETDSKFYVDEYGNVTMNNLKANNAELKGKLVTSSGKIELNSVQRTDYVWSGLATPANVYGVGYNDAVCIGIRDYGNNDYAARLNLIGYGDVKGAITLHVGNDGTSATAVSKLRMGPNTTTDKVVLDGVNGSVESDTVKFNKNILLNTGKITSTSGSLDGNDAVTDADMQMIICTSNGDQTVKLASAPPNGTVIVIKKTTNSGFVTIKNENNSEIGRFSEGAIICVYYNGWK